MAPRPDDHLVGALVGQRLAEQIALDGVAAEVAHALEILGGLDALGGDDHAEALGELDDRLDDRDILRPRAGFADEAAVDLQFVEHRLVQIADRRIAGAEIVERDADAERAQALQHVERRAVVAEEHALGDFELDPVARQLVAGERLADDVGQRRAWTICLGLMLSATVIGSGQVAAARQASSITHSPIAGISPISSATGMKTFGGTRPRCGWFQRISASNPISFWVLALTRGWKARWNCLAAIAWRRSVSRRTRSSCSDCSSDEK